MPRGVQVPQELVGSGSLHWGNRSLLFRDPDGNLVNFFTPVTPEAVKKLKKEV
jgi:hypothetical protein